MEGLRDDPDALLDALNNAIAYCIAVNVVDDEEFDPEIIRDLTYELQRINNAGT